MLKTLLRCEWIFVSAFDQVEIETERTSEKRMKMRSGMRMNTSDTLIY